MSFNIANMMLRIIPQKYCNRFYSSSSRTKNAIGNILVSMVSKGIIILVSFLIVPMTINYVNATQYGIWLTISSVMGWITYFDLGFGNGFRNKYAEAKANNDLITQKQYVSTTYFATTVLVIFIYILASVINICVDWSELLKIDSSYSQDLKVVFAIVAFFFCLHMVLSTFSYLLLADQKPGLLSMLQVVGQVLSLLVIIVLTKVSQGSLVNLALFYSSIPTIVLMIASVIFFRCKYRTVTPSLKFIKPHLIQNILNLGIQFFFITICLILVFQIVNVVISRELGPDSVTEYNIAYKYFHLLYMFMVIIITPFWSAFTDAYSKGDMLWMKKSLKKLEQSWLVAVGIGIVMLIISPWFYKFWVGEQVHVSFYVSIALLIYMLVQTLGAIYMQLINGIGTIRLQLYTYCVFALVSWPIITYSCRIFGVYGAVSAPVLAYLVQSVLGKIQIEKLLANKAKGIWHK